MRTAISAGQANAPAGTGNKPRMIFIDNLRVWLTALVILHHLAITYGRTGPWYYLVPDTTDAATTASFVFVLFNQAYFMGLFFGVSAYFTPGSVDRKGTRRFVKDRAIRLGVPLALFFFVLGPIAGLPSALAQPGPYTVGSYLSSTGFGPLWFVELLIIFTAAYLAVRRGRPAPAPRDETPRGRTLIIFTVLLALATYLYRIAVPFGTYLPYLDLPSIYELPQYVSFFVIGALAYRRGWLANLPSRFGIIGGIAAAAATVFLFTIAAQDPQALTSPGSWRSGVYAAWEAIFAVGFSLALLVFFRRFANRQGRLGTELSRSAFPAYVVHAPLITWLAIALRSLTTDPFLGFVVAALIGVPLTFLAAAGLRRLPGLRRVF